MKIKNTKMKEKFNLDFIEKPECVVRMTLAGFPNCDNRYIAVKSDGDWFIEPGEETKHQITHTALVIMSKNCEKVVITAIELDPYNGSGELSSFEKAYNTKIQAKVVSKDYLEEMAKHFSPDYYLLVETGDEDFVAIGFRDILRRDLSWVVCKEVDNTMNPWNKVIAIQVEFTDEEALISFGGFELKRIKNKEDKSMKHRHHPIKAVKNTACGIGSSFIWGVKHPIKAVKRNAGHVASIPHNIKCAITHK